MSISFFIELEKIPKTTAQQKKVRVVNNIPLFYDHPNLKLAKSIFIKELAKYKPKDKLTGAVSLKILWQFEKTKKSKTKTCRQTKPESLSLEVLNHILQAKEVWYQMET